MAYRDLTERYRERRENLRKRKVRFKLRQLADASMLVSGLFPTQKQASLRWCTLVAKRRFDWRA